jgi:hypothetical protein
MNPNSSPDSPEALVAIATIPGRVEILERVTRLFLEADIQPCGGESRVYQIEVLRKHQATAEAIIERDAVTNGYAITIYSKG